MSQTASTNYKVRPAPAEDIQFILDKVQQHLPKMNFHKEKILLTGGTGFFGKWLTQALLAMNDRLGLGNQITLVTRSQSGALKNLPWLNGRQDIRFIESDIRELATDENFTTIIHGAAAASQALNESRPEEMFDTIVEGTRRILQIAEKSKSRKVQLISSGGVYGAQPPDLHHIPETYMSAPDVRDHRAAYGEAKRASEFLAFSAQRRCGFHLSVPRCFAFVGPYLPLDTHFAAGNFLKCVLDSQPIKVGGDGTPYRSYLYAADLMVWLLVLLNSEEKSGIYNVGSGESINIRQLAETIHIVGCKIKPERSRLENPIQVAAAAKPGAPASRYVPAVTRAKEDLKLEVWTDLPSSISKTLLWNM